MQRDSTTSSVLLAIPNEGWLRTDLFERVRAWAPQVSLYMPQGLRPVSYAKNVCMNACLEGDFEYIFFVDSDTVPPEHALDALLEADVPMISGITHQMKCDSDGKMKPCPMVVRDDYPVTSGQGVEGIDACGASCLLIHRSVIEKTLAPWFETDDWGEPRRGSDFNFCRKVASAGIPMHAHFGVVCVHRKEVDI